MDEKDIILNTCSKCNKKDTKDKFTSKGNVCKDCYNAYRKHLRLKYMNDDVTVKTCNECKIEKKLKDMYPFSLNCRDCYNKSRKIENLDKSEKEKKCPFCNETKPIERFRTKLLKCKDCRNKQQREYMIEYYKNNKEQLNQKKHERNKFIANTRDCESSKLCKDCSLEKKITDFRVARNKCKDCERLFNRNWAKNKKHNNPIYKLIGLCRTRIVQTIKKISKKQSTMEYIGLEISDLEYWIEFCFDENMNWENHGEYWHLDHVIPVSKFNISSEEDVIKCFNWKNLSPLYHKDNLKKSNNIIKDQVLKHIEKLEEFNKINDNKFADEINNYKLFLNIYL